jgi:hypothetical protein
MKITSAGDIDGIRDISLQQNLLALLIDIGIGNRRQECFGIRVQGIGKYAAGISHFNNFTQVNDDAMGYVLHNGEIVGNKKIGEIQLMLKV